jgi:23S rRNA (uridine2552-2'-O)-methyltransferase
MVNKSPNNSGFKDSLKSKKPRKLSSQLWLKRHINDIYVRSAQKDGYYSRASYKILEINEKYKIFKSGQKVVDLGAAPGGWSQVVGEIIFKNNAPSSQLIAIDLLDIKDIQYATLLKGDFTDLEMLEQIKNLFNGEKIDVVMSDMSPNTTGSKSVDHIKIMYLVEMAFDFAITHLKTNGVFIAKVFQGGTENTLLAKIKQHFNKVEHFKPPASRKESNEIYLVAIGFKL